MTDKSAALRALFEQRDHFIAADAYSVMTARIVEQVGFKAAYLGGHACSAFHYGIPDNGIFSQVEQLEQAARIAESIDIPLIADADTLGETVADAYHITRRYIRAGIAGFHIEDEVNPKHSAYDNGLISIADMQARIEACVDARGDSAFVIIARCDELYPSAYGGGGGGDIEEAIARGKAYVEAGADALCFPLVPAEVAAKLQERIDAPFVVLGPPVPTATCTLHTGWGWMGAAKLHLQYAKELMETGSVSFDPSFPEKGSLIEQDLYDRLIGEWATKTGRPVRGG
ncbi:isocitrate lyase/PEP mutase family protein [Mangrovimicrobium sediminis]|uniref:Isocitrate lyase/PEP mutase family protein n=1 Tax=Mangrovimicrobium sediminis TaxID=2562682 RepID=A0A4Z0LUS5_9GAMM|nr:isocitrate lyase/PEP mutase family protein [Haliea sp. SAOS-164]TGD70815.1 isocitrate lyase/PEP mutase family protein [Haliea sp. SAOS-164]